MRKSDEVVVSDELVDTRQVRRPDIDGLRGIAVLAVVLFHFAPSVVSAGLVGVDIFFVISGFVITSLLLREQPMRWRGLVSFWGHRVRRIFPALAVMLLIVLVAGWWVLWPQSYALLGSATTWSAAMLGNVFMWSQTGYFVAQPIAYPLLNLWSLGVEEQFYLAWPVALAVLIWLLRGRVPHLAAVALLLAVTSWVASVWWVAQGDDPAVAEAAVFYLPWFRAWELLAGALVAMALYGSWRGRWLKAAEAMPRWVMWVVTLLLVLSCMWAPPTRNPAWYALGPVILAAVAIWLGSGAGRSDASPLANRPLLFFGAISYSLYLWHWPILAFAAALGLTSWMWTAAALGLSVLLAWLSRRFVEIPVMRRPVTVRLVTGVVALLVVVAALGLFVTKSHGFPQRTVGVAADLSRFQYDQTSDYREGECFSTTTMPIRGAWPARCLTTRPGTAGVLLWGDSLAASMYAGLEAKLGDQVTLSQVTAGACPPVPSAAARSEDCAAAHAAARNSLSAQRWDAVILAGDWTASLAAEIPEEVRAIREATGLPADRVVVVGPLPEWDPSLPGAWPYAVAQSLEELPQYSSQGLVPGRSDLDTQMKTVVEGSGARYVSALDAMCRVDGCLVRTGPGVDSLTAWDLYHLTRDGSNYLGDRIVAALPRLS